MAPSSWLSKLFGRRVPAPLSQYISLFFFGSKTEAGIYFPLDTRALTFVTSWAGTDRTSCFSMIP
jgi:hypothetical protein